MEHYGKERKGRRKPIPYPDNWMDVYNEWRKGNGGADKKLDSIRRKMAAFIRKNKKKQR
ncbi:hypothetical protein AALB39_11300 [Lachnospiraceae bacterium 54-53]